MKKYEVTLHPNNQPTILVGYFDSKSEINDYLNTVGIKRNDKNLSIIKNSKNTRYKNCRGIKKYHELP